MRTENTAKRLKAIMDNRGLRQIDIIEMAKPYCERFGVKIGRNDISQYVSGKVEPGQRKLTVLGLALGVSETWLMGYDVDRDGKPLEATSRPERHALLSLMKDATKEDIERAVKVLEVILKK